MSEVAIRVDDVSKLYKLYDKPSDRLKESLGLTRKKLYKEHYALHNVSFDVKRGETVGIIGTNGSGKSTILKIITGVLNPSGGHVEIDGRISALLELGAGFNMEYTGIENIYLNGTMIGFSREEIDAKMQDILDFADIGDFVHQPVKTYSSGMFVRLAFAVAINIDPEILIVDEALSVGDVFFQAKCYKKFEDFKKMGKTILFVSHDLGSISKYCDRVVLLNRGKKLAEGTPKEMVSMYKRIMVNQDKAEEIAAHQMDMSSLEEDDEKEIKEAVCEGQWKNHYNLNPDVDEYGNGAAEIEDFAIIDENGNYTNAIVKGTRFRLKSKVKFKQDVHDPIFTYTFKNIQGVAITGTNTMYEKKDVPLAKEGETYVATFEQDMFLQGGEYLLSMSCTGYRDGEFQVYHRLYDVCNVTVVSDKNTVGFYDMNSVTTVEKIDE
ncbi:ABC transporter ATP-binding protein [Roseburia sp. AF15-21]|jgi:teichoic acid transport system ATP-binding protein|uniref:ABC transporter ATP-binding protein n=1 Tax=unclassified Roseburia TaxID=2637578 RepID=UPI000E4B1E26|nr:MULTISPECIES: ABC transporter ATP-binding protein [unclassified Roseburia]RGI46095.1 ABC transporter ATP-binding protein [Roseburia sp. OM03-7AC]RGI48690.1 ABC transporter ATP-binding protein [Roseburia sp. OM03-18]RHR88521.1 ABC transporter ATP-binding protein [Roseburia sp. AF15-21]